MVFDDSNSQIGIECRKTMYLGHDEKRMTNPNYLLDSN